MREEVLFVIQISAVEREGRERSELSNARDDNKRDVSIDRDAVFSMSKKRGNFSRHLKFP